MIAGIEARLKTHGRTKTDRWADRRGIRNSYLDELTSDDFNTETSSINPRTPSLL